MDFAVMASSMPYNMRSQAALVVLACSKGGNGDSFASRLRGKERRFQWQAGYLVLRDALVVA